MRIGIMGAGHAGVEAARAVAAQGAGVVLFSDESCLPYYRPRLVALSMRQATLAEVTMHPADWYAGRGIELRLDTPVERFDAAARTVTAGGREEQFDALVIAYGAVPFLPAFMTNAPPAVWPLWNRRQAEDIADRILPHARLVVVGGGILGVEAAVRAADQGVRVTIVEMQDRLMPAQFGAQDARALAGYLAGKGLQILLQRSVRTAQPRPDGALDLTLDNQQTLNADLVLVSIGARRNPEPARQAGLPVARGIPVDEQMRTRTPGVFACGDIIEIASVNRCSAPDAVLQGAVAGANAVLAAAGKDLLTYKPSDGAVNFKYNQFEVHAVGMAPDSQSREIALEVDGSEQHACRTLVVKDGKLVGIGMLNTSRDFRTYLGQLQKAFRDE